MQNTITRQLNGKSATKLVISGEGQAVKAEIYRLFNAGVVTGMPYGMEHPDFEDATREGEVSLECKTYKKKFFAGLEVLADLELQKELGGVNLAKLSERREWRTLRAERAGEIFTRDFTDKEKEAPTVEKEETLSDEEKQEIALARKIRSKARG